MALTAYEAVFIMPTAQDDAVRTTTEKYRSVLENGGATIDDVDTWDARRLAYPIKKNREGVYVVMNFLATPEAKNELERICRISDDLLRHMIVKQDKKADRFPSKIRAAEAEKRERDMAARAAQQVQAENDLPVITDLPADPDPAPIESKGEDKGETNTESVSESAE